MEPNKFEKQFKEQLNSREIKPSKMAWDKLDAMLTVAEKPKRNFKWVYVAASITGFLLVSTVYLNREKNNDIQAKGIVVVQEKAIINPSNSKTIINAIVKTERSEDTLETKWAVQEKRAQLISNKKTDNKKNETVLESSINQNQIAEQSIINQENEQKSIKTQTNSIAIEELVTSVVKTSKPNQIVGVKVDATNLLQQVDGELDLSFRQKVITKVSKNYQAIKVALANRNLE